jgi:O-antigen ligase
MQTKKQLSTPRAEMLGKALYQGGLLAAIFLAPLIWGRFEAFPGALIFAFLGLSAVGRLLMGPARCFPAGLPLSTFHLALAGFLLITGTAYFSSLSRYATDLELIKLGAGALLFWLVLQNRVPSQEMGVESSGTKVGRAKAKSQKAQLPAPPPQTAAFPGPSLGVFLVLIVIGLASQDWDYYYSFEQKLVLAPLLLLALAFVALRFRHNPAALPLWETAVASCGVVASYGIYDWLFMRLTTDNPKWHTFSTFFNPNPLAGFLGMALFLALGGLLFTIARRKENPRAWAFPALATLLILAALPATDSKGAYLSIYFAGLFFLVLLITTRPLADAKKTLLISLLLLITLALPIGSIMTHPSLKAEAAKQLSLQNKSNMFRYLTWKASYNMAKAHPWLGVGPGAFEYGFGRFAIAGYTRRAHQNYLEAAATIGFPGMVGFLWLLGSGVIGVSRAFRRAAGLDKYRAAGALGALLVMIFHSLLDYDWYLGASQLYFFLAAALGISAAPPGETSLSHSRRKWPAGIGILVLIVLAGKALTLGGAEKELQQARQLRIQGRSWEAKDHLEAAQRLASVYAKAKWLSGVVLAKDLQRFPEALPPLQQAVALEPAEATYWNSLGEVQARIGQFDKAIQAFSRAAKQNPQFLRPQLHLAEIKLLLGKPADAVSAWEKIIQIQQGPAGKYQAIDYEVKTEYAEAHYDLGLAGSKGFAPDGEAALRHFQSCQEILAEYERIGRGLDEQRRAIGDVDPGKTEQLKLLKAKCLYRLAQRLAAQGQGKAAQPNFTQAAGLMPKIGFYIAEEDRLWGK